MNVLMNAVAKANVYNSPSRISEWEKGKHITCFFVSLKLAVLYECFTDDFYPSPVAC